MWARSALSLGLLCSSIACGSSDDSAKAPRLQKPDDGLSDACHPFRASGVCGLPYPSSAWSVQDAASRTGRRLSLPSELIAASASTSAPFDPSEWNRLDGFSPATPILAYLEARLDPASLIVPPDYDASLSPQSPTLLLDVESGELVAHFSEVDQSGDVAESDRQPLMIRPLSHLQPNRRYAAAITRSARTTAGGEPARPLGFESALAGARSDVASEQALLERTAEIVDTFEAVGVKKSELVLAWDFETGSAEQMTENVLAMRDVALADVGESGIGYAITSVEDAPHAETFKRVRGTFSVPSFLSSDDRTEAEAVLVLGADGKPERQRVSDYPFELVVPQSAVDNGPYPLLIYGHGLLGGADEVGGSHVRGFCNEKRWLCIGTDWIGLSESETTGIGASAAAVLAIQDVNSFPWVGDRLQQALVNFMVLVRAAKSIAQDPQVALPDGSSPLAEPFVVQYYGISQGAIMGMSLMAYSPDLARGVLQVGGSAYSLMIQRSVNWNQFLPAIRNAYPDRVDQQLVMALWQPLFDRSEGSGTAFSQGVHAPLPGTQPKQLLMQIAVGDSQVTNLAAEIQARTLGLPLLEPSVQSIWGLETAASGAPQAITLWDLERDPPPLTNATPLEDNDVHGDIRKLPENRTQTDVFLRSGKVEDTCAGPCAFPDL